MGRGLCFAVKGRVDSVLRAPAGSAEHKPNKVNVCQQIIQHILLSTCFVNNSDNIPLHPDMWSISRAGVFSTMCLNLGLPNKASYKG